MSRWTHRKSHRCDRRLAWAFYRNAAGFHESAEAAMERFPEMTRYFLAIAIELSLKAYLLQRGISDDWNRIHIRHDLIKALRCARRGGLKEPPGGLVQLAVLLSPYYQTRRICEMQNCGLTMLQWVAHGQAGGLNGVLADGGMTISKANDLEEAVRLGTDDSTVKSRMLNVEIKMFGVPFHEYSMTVPALVRGPGVLDEYIDTATFTSDLSLSGQGGVHR